MPEPFLGEIRIFSFDFPPRGWAACDGQLLPINQQQALFSLLGNMYGGDGQITFALPDLRGRVPLHFDQAIPQGTAAGEYLHALTLAELPSHSHVPKGDANPGTDTSPAGNVWASARPKPYSNSADGLMDPAAISATGGGQAHNNVQPYLVLNFCIALTGIFPARE